MPKNRKYFSQADNNDANVVNVLRDPMAGLREEVQRVTGVAEAIEDAPVEIDVEAGAPFTDGIDPEATVGEYRELEADEEPEVEAPEEETKSPTLEEMLSNYAEKQQNEPVSVVDAPIVDEEEAEETPEEEVAEAEEEVATEEGDGIEEGPLEALDPIHEIDADAIIHEARENRASHAVAESVRQNFVKDMESVSEEAVLRIDAKPEEEEASTERPKFVPVSQRIKKPRFSRRDKVVEEENDPILDAEIIDDELEAPKEAAAAPAPETELEDDILDREIVDEDEIPTAPVSVGTDVPKKQNSICEDLHRLQDILEAGKSPMFHKDEVLVPREETLTLIRSLTNICDVDASYIDYAAEDVLIDKLVDGEGETYRPMQRARERSRSIINQATRQADNIIRDAKTLSRQILAEAEAEIKAKYDIAEKDISAMASVSKEESAKKLNEARGELTYSRQRSVEILSKYMEKAEDDYQGYWERAEQTLIASMKKSESILGKAADIYKKELATIRADKEEIDDILERLRIMQNFNNSMKKKGIKRR